MKFSYKKALSNLRKNKRLLLSGPAGTGKSYLIHQLRKEGNIVVLATTGIAAAQIGGMTIHKFFKLGICNNKKDLAYYTKTSIEKIMHGKDVSYERAAKIFFHPILQILPKCDFIVIDEVSMMSADLLDMVVERLRETGFSDIPILFVGDFYQLPPVSKKNNVKFAFESPYWNNVQLIELSEIKRTQDIYFANMQKEVRIGKPTGETLNFIHSLAFNEVDDNVTRLLSLNADVKAHNTNMLLKVEGELFKSEPIILYKADYIDEAAIHRFIDDLNLDHELFFKKGAKIIFTSNSPLNEYFNGEVGTIIDVDLKNKSLLIKSDFTGEEIGVTRKSFKLIKYVTDKDNNVSEEELLTVLAYPFKLGYALTIHKSQGMTLSEGYVDCSGIFLKEQFYTAFSRFSSPKKVCIKNFDQDRHIGSNPYIERFYENCKRLPLEEFAYEKDEEEKVEEVASLSDLKYTKFWIKHF